MRWRRLHQIRGIHRTPGGGFALKTGRTGTGCNSRLHFECQDAIAEEQDFLAEQNNLVLDPCVHIGLDPDSPSLRLLLLRDLDLFNVRVEELFSGCEGCCTGWLCHGGWSWG